MAWNGGAGSVEVGEVGGLVTPVMGTKGEDSTTEECQVDGDPI